MFQTVKRLRQGLYTAALLLVSCQSTSHLVTIPDKTIEIQSLTEGEKRIWSMSEDAEIQIRKSGQLFKSANAKKALEEMLYKLFPEHKDNMRIAIIKRPILNAFAFPNGSIYIHTGIITAAQNESQLAAVVAHEGAHFLFRHGAKSRIHRQNMTNFALSLNLIGIPLIGELIGASSVFGYSRDLEREADLEGAKRMINAGYDINEAYKMFEFMASEAKANEIEEPFFFATHPKLLERIENFKKFAIENQTLNNTTDKNNNSYTTTFSVVNNYALHKKLELGRYSSLINELIINPDVWEKLHTVDDKIIYAEAYRLRGKKGDFSAARKLLEEIQTASPDNWKIYLSLGVMDLQESNFLEAKSNLLKAKDLTSDDNGYIAMYLNKIKHHGEKNND